jgi:hypothetical protein
MNWGTDYDDILYLFKTNYSLILFIIFILFYENELR